MINKSTILLLALGISTALLLISGFTTNIDLGKSKGIQQSTIILLIPSPSAVEVAPDVTIKVVFNVALKEVEKDSIKLKKISDKEKKIKGKVSYISTEKTITFKPQKLLEVGFYEIEIEGLKEKKIKEIKYRFYVPEVVNCYMLPVEPNAKINNSTLLGIDSNSNGIRDDVERYVIKRYAKDPEFPKTKMALAMKYAWASQKILENPTMESSKYEDDAIGCQYYWFDQKQKDINQRIMDLAETDFQASIQENLKAGQWRQKNKVFNDSEIKDNMYNTKERIEQYFSYNAALSGNIFDGRNESINNCQINIDELGE